MKKIIKEHRLGISVSIMFSKIFWPTKKDKRGCWREKEFMLNITHQIL
jgi:hypothetical protein